jgi:hypothetical protein
MEPEPKAKFPTTFGVFSPTGHVVMAFASDGDAERARGLLIQNGFAAEDVVHYGKNEVMAALKKSEKQSASPLQIGQEVEKVDEYLALAEKGCGFIALHAKEDEAAKRAVSLVKHLGLKLAEKYNALTIEKLA